MPTFVPALLPGAMPTSAWLGINKHPMQIGAKCGIFKPKLLLSTLVPFEPYSFKKAFHFKEWCDAMSYEYNTLIQNSTWSLVPRPHAQKIIGCHQVFKTKELSSGAIDKRKARLVAEFNLQTHGINFKETLNPVVKACDIRVILSPIMFFIGGSSI